MAISRFCFWLLLLVGLSACAVRGTDEAAQFSLRESFSGMVDFTVLKELVLKDNCLGCHAGFGEEAGLAPFVVPGMPGQSKLFLEVESGRMPKDAARLPEEGIRLVRDYIEGLKQSIPLPPLEPTYASLSVHLFAVRCTKCHAARPPGEPPPSRRKPMVSYEQVVALGDDIEFRMVEKGDMPPKNRAPAVSDELKALFLEWRARGMPK